MREFYVYGFKHREEYNAKSPRSYDNERRRLESWLGEYMFFRQCSTGKQVFISVDSRNIVHNPLYQAFKAKSFTRGDLLLHFFLMDILRENQSQSVREIMECIFTNYLSRVCGNYELDESTLRKKLREYEELGLLTSKKCGRELLYYRTISPIDVKVWKIAASFFSEAAPLGVIGSYLLDSQENTSSSYFGFKHHYMLHVLDSEILITLLDCMTNNCFAALEVAVHRPTDSHNHTIFPLKIFISTQTGRQYIMAQSLTSQKIVFYRLDNIQKATMGAYAPQHEVYRNNSICLMTHLWGVSIGSSHILDHIEMTVHVSKGEEYIVQRLEREKRCGTVYALDNHTYSFTADVYDAAEMLPWIRTFIGRIIGLSCSNQSVINTFYADLSAMQSMYGGDSDAIS